MSRILSFDEFKKIKIEGFTWTQIYRMSESLEAFNIFVYKWYERYRFMLRINNHINQFGISLQAIQRPIL